ncbi:MAG: hypothetical protein LBV69_03090 [Bacteroidales bacterium]|jgi:predicted RNA-binding Zn-ribbon protein involved in translation (DUF1610 family)|nr:hypothetical protein [Bacteroidales bacterium]
MGKNIILNIIIILYLCNGELKTENTPANFYCEYCGAKYSSVSSLTSNWCSKHPDGASKGKHKLYEGSEKNKYTCKYCGQMFITT